MCTHLGVERWFKVCGQESIFQVLTLPDRRGLWCVLGTQSTNSFRASFCVFNTGSCIKLKSIKLCVLIKRSLEASLKYRDARLTILKKANRHVQPGCLKCPMLSPARRCSTGCLGRWELLQAEQWSLRECLLPRAAQLCI